MARLSIFLAATLLSLFGFFLNVGAFFSFLGSGLILAGASLFLCSIYAWVAYFVIGHAWIYQRRISLIWVGSGTVAGLLALNGGGAFFFADNYSPKAMVVPALSVLPALLFVAWACLYQLRSKGL